MSFLTEIISERFLYALGWTLLHSIWQGILVAVFTAVLLVFLHRQASRVRYLMSATSLLLILGLAVFTFAKLYMQYPENTAAIDKVSSEGPMVAVDLGQLNIQQSLQEKQTGSLAVWNAFYTKYAGYFQKHLPMIVILWTLGITVLFLRFLGGLAYSRRLKHYKVTGLSQDWQDKVIVLASDLGVRRAVKLMESAIVKVPVVIGYFKPVILLPVGLITSIPTEQLEAILIHELAHVYRRDYLVNILQSLIDILFFYHPAVWWLSAVIRQERENCCDDIVLEYTQNTSTYARALTNIEAIQQAPELVMAFGKDRASLLNRVRRILDKPQIRPDFTDGLVMAFFFFICFAALIFQAKAELPSKEKFEDLKRNQAEQILETDQLASDSSKKSAPVRLEFMGSSRKSVGYQEEKPNTIEQQLPQDTPDSPDTDLDIEREVEYDFEKEETVENDDESSHSQSYEYRIAPAPETNQYTYSFSSSDPQSNNYYVPNDEWEQYIPADSLKKWKERQGDFRVYKISPTQDGKGRVLIINGSTIKVFVNGEETATWNPEEFEKFDVILDSLDSDLKFAVIPDMKVISNLEELPDLNELKNKLEALKALDSGVWRVVNVANVMDSFELVTTKELALARMEQERSKLEYEKEMHAHKLEQSHKALERLEKRLNGVQGHDHEMEKAHRKMEKANELREEIVEQLVKDDLVEEGEHFTFIISKKELFLNGKKQQRSVHKDYLELFDKLQKGSLSKDQQFIFSE